MSSFCLMIHSLKKLYNMFNHFKASLQDINKVYTIISSCDDTMAAVPLYSIKSYLLQNSGELKIALFKRVRQTICSSGVISG